MSEEDKMRRERDKLRSETEKWLASGEELLQKKIRELMYEDKSIDDGYDVLSIIEEMTQDVVPAQYWIEWAKKTHETDGQITKNYKFLILQLAKWLGGNKTR